jgi:DNA helicase IV
MNKELSNQYRAYAKRISFVREAAFNGVLDKMRISQRNKEIGIVFNCNIDATTDEITGLFESKTSNIMTKQRVSQINRIFLKEMWKRSGKLRNKYSEEDIFTRKPSHIDPQRLIDCARDAEQ